MCVAPARGEAASTPATRESLERIADVLGCPVAAFLTGEGLPADLSARHELLMLWGTLRTDASRQEALELLRLLAAKD